MRNIFIDCGANLGLALKKFMEELSGYEFFAFEPNAALHPHIQENTKHLAARSSLSLFQQAVWIEDGTTSLYLGQHESSTVMLGKRMLANYGPPIDYANPVAVPAVDFSSWIARTFSRDDSITVKMDIEGAEYPVLRKMVADNTLPFIKVLYVEWHHDRFDYMSNEEHSALVQAVSRQVEIRPW
jgi:FkbM family methyltransferase